MLQVRTLPPAEVTLETVGLVMLAGRSALAESTALRTSFKASSVFLSISKETLMATEPSVMVVVMWSSLVSEASLSSILRATWVSSWAGAAPSSEAAILMVGRSMSGKFWMPSPLKAWSPKTVKRTKSNSEGTGFLMAQADTFMIVTPLLP